MKVIILRLILIIIYYICNELTNERNLLIILILLRTNETYVSILSILLLSIDHARFIFRFIHILYMVWSVLTHFLGTGTAYSLLRRGSSQEKQLNIYLRIRTKVYLQRDMLLLLREPVFFA